MREADGSISDNDAEDSSQVGFTLVELLVVVALIGVLSSLAIVGYRKYVHSAQSSEAKSMIEAIRGAEEVYKSEMLQYLDVSAGSSGGLYPNATPNDTRTIWGSAGNDLANWQILNVHADSAVRFGYAVRAGAGSLDAGQNPIWPNTTYSTDLPALPVVPTGVPWYVVEAVNSHWMDPTRYVVYGSTSLGSEIVSYGETN